MSVSQSVSQSITMTAKRQYLNSFCSRITIVIIVKCSIERNIIVHRHIISHIVHAKHDAYALLLVIHRYEHSW